MVYPNTTNSPAFPFSQQGGGDSCTSNPRPPCLNAGGGPTKPTSQQNPTSASGNYSGLPYCSDFTLATMAQVGCQLDFRPGTIQRKLIDLGVFFLGGGVTSKILENYILKALARQAAVAPAAENSSLQNVIAQLYKGVTNPERVRDGTTMDAIRNELATGEPTGGTFHSIKGQESTNALRNILRKNPNLSDSDRRIAERLIEQLQEALGGE